MAQPRDPGGLLTSALRRFQRRLRWLAWGRYLIVAAPIALGAADVVLLLSGQEGVAFRVWTLSLAIAVIAAGLLAVVRTPSLAATARIVDCELALQDRAVSALQFSAEADPFSRLVTADAAARLGELPASRLPFKVPAPARWLAASMFTISALIFFVMSGSSRSAPPVRVAPGGATADAGERSREGRPQRVIPNAPGGATDSRATASPSAPDSTPPAQARTAESRTPGRTTAPDDPTTETAPRTEGTPGDSGAAAQAGSRAAPQTPGVKTSAGRDGGYAPQGNASELSTRGRGAAAPGARDTRGGGVSGGAVAAGEVPSARSESPPGANRAAAAYAAAYARAESAMPAERVPPALRSYVRDYFMAIRPGSTPWP